MNDKIKELNLNFPPAGRLAVNAVWVFVGGMLLKGGWVVLGWILIILSIIAAIWNLVELLGGGQ